jgi:OOP family OmpA-OmpF porin
VNDKKILDMKKSLLLITCLIAFVALGLNKINAQDSTRSYMITAPPLFSGNDGFRTWSIGLHGGAMMPFSAYGGKTNFSNGLANFEYGGYLKYQASHVFGVQLDVLSGKLEANNNKLWGGLPPVSPYTSFKTDIHWAASLSGVVTLGNINWNYLNTNIQPYLSLGLGYVNFNPTTTDNAGVVTSYKPVGSITDLYIPLGVGFKASVTENINVDLGYTTAYVDAADLTGYLKAPYFGSKFSYAHIGLEFSLGNSSKPQLAKHNAPAQLNKKVNDENNALKGLVATLDQKYNNRLAELNRLKEEQNKLKLDSDNDGVSDYFDKCPGTLMGERVDGAGCPLPKNERDTLTKVYNNTTYVITEEDRKIANDAVRNLEFEFGKSTIREKSLPYLNKVAALLINKDISLKLGGHTDGIGSETANMMLSKDRAESVKNYLTQQGANASKIEAVGYGETQPIATNKNEAGRQKNRRVEFTLY